MANSYSNEWYETFLGPIPAQTTATELAFIGRHLPVEEFPRLLDLCCGSGRHACELTARGYRVLGVDVNPHAVVAARRRCPGGSFAVCDMRSLDTLATRFDGIINLWHSFGYFDEATNRDVLRQIHGRLRPGGRTILDVYNRAHSENRPSEEVALKGARQVRTTRAHSGARHRVQIEYDGTLRDEFDWELYNPTELERICVDAGLHPLVRCAWFDEAIPPSPDHARMQFVCERRQ